MLHTVFVQSITNGTTPSDLSYVTPVFKERNKNFVKIIDEFNYQLPYTVKIIQGSTLECEANVLRSIHSSDELIGCITCFDPVGIVDR